jgi:hypothetical protein
MPEIGLQRSGIDALVGQCVAAGMPEHVGMNLEPNLSFVAVAAPENLQPSCVSYHILCTVIRANGSGERWSELGGAALMVREGWL